MYERTDKAGNNYNLYKFLYLIYLPENQVAYYKSENGFKKMKYILTNMNYIILM